MMGMMMHSGFAIILYILELTELFSVTSGIVVTNFTWEQPYGIESTGRQAIGSEIVIKYTIDGPHEHFPTRFDAILSDTESFYLLYTVIVYWTLNINVLSLKGPFADRITGSVDKTKLSSKFDGYSVELTYSNLQAEESGYKIGYLLSSADEFPTYHENALKVTECPKSQLGVKAVKERAVCTWKCLRKYKCPMYHYAINDEYIMCEANGLWNLTADLCREELPVFNMTVHKKCKPEQGGIYIATDDPTCDIGCLGTYICPRRYVASSLYPVVCGPGFKWNLTRKSCKRKKKTVIAVQMEEEEVTAGFYHFSRYLKQKVVFSSILALWLIPILLS